MKSFRKGFTPRTPIRGFTLIELLVVMVVIIILAAILFPVFSAIKGKARQVSCLSNLKQIGSAFDMYLQDNDEKFPIYHDQGVDAFHTRFTSKHFYWHNKLSPYMKDYSIYLCPGAESSVEKSVYEGPGDAATETFIGGSGSYGYNYYYLGRNGSIPLSSVSKPSNTLLLGEITKLVHSCVIYPSPVCVGDPNWQVAEPNEVRRLNYWKQYSSRHSEGSNILFVDGHAGWKSRGHVESHPEIFYNLRDEVSP